MSEKETPLYGEHVAAAARMAPFAGWTMPLHYGSQIAEHHAVRRTAGMFDVSHMTVIDIAGADALRLLRLTMANDPAKAVPGKAVYGALLNTDGGIIDDLIVYGREEGYRAVVNASTRDRVLDWLLDHAAPLTVEMRERTDVAMVAVQGPEARTQFAAATGIDTGALGSFSFLERGTWMVARTGYTGEDGVEVLLPATEAVALWQRLKAVGVAPAGLAARDTLRLEAGLNLYGQDMDERVTPLESNLAWTVAWSPEDRDFIGRAALVRQRAEKPARVLKGVVLSAKGVMRQGYVVTTNLGDGVVTSGVFSPTLGYSIALARLPRGAVGDCTVKIRTASVPARIVRPPFVRDGKRTNRQENKHE